MRVKELVAFIKAREAVRLAKEAGKPKPWTKDAILQTYRFCNVHREDDAVTRWVADNIRKPLAKHPDLWFALIVARLLNLPASIEAIDEHILPFNPKQFMADLHSRVDYGLKNFNAAYIVSTNGLAMDKVEYITNNVLNPAWVNRELVRPTKKDTLTSFAKRLNDLNGMGSFLTGQVVADLKYTKPLDAADDWWTFALSGPGSRRGLNRVFGLDLKFKMPEYKWHEHLMRLQREVNARLPEPLHAQDLQNCLCEFDKYERIRLGEGRPKQLYDGRK